MKNIILKKIPFPVKLVISDVLYKFFQLRIKMEHRVPKVNKFEETVNYIINNRASVSRFGDGEFKWIFQKREEGNFEKNSPELSIALKKVLGLQRSNLIICIPDVFEGLNQYTIQAREFWGLCLGRYGSSWVNMLNSNRVYFDTQFTRPYMDYRIKDNVGRKFSLLKSIWNDRNVLLVEGNKSRFGVGNDLLLNARSVKRILAPETNAFEKYGEIKKTVLEELNNKNDNVLVLISLGPTATVLSAELSMKNIQSIDIGHLDIEYSWYLLGASKKIAIDGKYVNEVPDTGHRVGAVKNKKSNDIYHSEIISTIEK